MRHFFDAHCHVLPDNSGQTAACCGDSGNGRLLCGVAPADWPVVAHLASVWPGTVPAFGLHPWHVAPQQRDWPEVLERLLHVHPDAWVGEIGLDSLKTSLVSEALQEQAFSRQLDLAQGLGRPVNLHCVKAYEPLRSLLDRHYLVEGPRAFILHSFNGPHQEIEQFRQRGAYFSVGVLASRRDTPRIRARIALLPQDRVVLESDAFLQPGIDAEEDLAYTVQWLAALSQESKAETWERVFRNSQRMCAYG